MRYRHISVAIPILAELDNLPELVKSLKSQTFRDFSIYCCVNNPEGWANSNDTSKQAMYKNNQACLEYLKHSNFNIIDRSSPGKGWQGKQHGVGWARRVTLEVISSHCDDNELIVSLDADTAFGEKYFECLLDTFNLNPECSALAVPYYHPLSGNECNDRAMLRYEIYMRHYLIRLMESGNPFAYTALGSAMAFPLWAYKRVGGITPLQGGEDFYLMQKFAKTGTLMLWCDETVHPQGRPSLRVPFGTGPAIAKGIDSMDSTYPLYPHEAFRAVEETYALFPKLYEEDIDTPMSDFLCQQLKKDNLWQPLRKNFKTRELFVHACQERVDGLRILQYLKTFPLRTAEEELQLLCDNYGISIPMDFSFRHTAIETVNSVRDALFEIETGYRKKSTQ